MTLSFSVPFFLPSLAIIHSSPPLFFFPFFFPLLLFLNQIKRATIFWQENVVGLLESIIREREEKKGLLLPLAMAPAGKLSGFRREGNDWYSFPLFKVLIFEAHVQFSGMLPEFVCYTIVLNSSHGFEFLHFFFFLDFVMQLAYSAGLF